MTLDELVEGRIILMRETLMNMGIPADDLSDEEILAKIERVDSIIRDAIRKTERPLTLMTRIQPEP